MSDVQATKIAGFVLQLDVMYYSTAFYCNMSAIQTMQLKR